jgi:hypothetical protein
MRLADEMMKTRTALTGVLLGLSLTIGATTAAHADQTDQAGSGPSGYTVMVSVHFSGDAAPGGGGSRTVSVHPSCWWAPAPGPYTDAAAMLDWYDMVTGGHETRGLTDQYGPRSVWEAAMEAEAAGQDLSWYHATCLDPADYTNFNLPSVEGGVDPVTGNPVGWVVYQYAPFGVGRPIPAPLVSPAELARVAHDIMVIPAPVTDRNPKIKAPGAPTLVGLPTWFWVVDPASVGGATGARHIRAELGNVWAEVTATTGGLRISSPAGSTTCGPAKALTRYADGTPQSRACTVAFLKASVGQPGGYRVAASTDWQATWVGSGGTGGADLDPLQRNATTLVPVAEVQNVVTR